MNRAEIQNLYIRVCRDSGFRLNYVAAAQIAASAGGFHPMDVWIAMPSLSVMQEIARGEHPASLPTPVEPEEETRA